MIGTASTAPAMTTGAGGAAMRSDATATRKIVARASAAMVVGATMIGIPTETAVEILIGRTRGHCQKWSGV